MDEGVNKLRHSGAITYTQLRMRLRLARLQKKKKKKGEEGTRSLQRRVKVINYETDQTSAAKLTLMHVMQRNEVRKPRAGPFLVDDWLYLLAQPGTGNAVLRKP